MLRPDPTTPSQIQNQEEEEAKKEDDDEVMSDLRQEVEKRKEANEKK